MRVYYAKVEGLYESTARLTLLVVKMKGRCWI